MTHSPMNLFKTLAMVGLVDSLGVSFFPKGMRFIFFLERQLLKRGKGDYMKIKNHPMIFRKYLFLITS